MTEADEIISELFSETSSESVVSKREFLIEKVIRMVNPFPSQKSLDRREARRSF